MESSNKCITHILHIAEERKKKKKKNKVVEYYVVRVVGGRARDSISPLVCHPSPESIVLVLKSPLVDIVPEHSSSSATNGRLGIYSRITFVDKYI